MSNIAESVQEYLSDMVKDLGYELVEVEYAKKQNGMNLTLFIDSKNGINLEDCEAVHLKADVMLDELDPTNGAPYTLNVSSLGLDRPIKTDADLNRNIDVEIEVSLYSKVDGKKNYVGKLVSFNSEEIVLLIEEKEVSLQRKNISKIIKYIEF